ncbi:MCE family protein [Pseudonocardiaceae bacterium YIM PH 21723]|nr:MCE family protein [Pseudonocardiaceae bacterium YIM PH 21723]
MLAGCGSGGFNGFYGTNLPGGADVGDNPYHVKINFADVLDLVPQAGVKVNDVPVGRVQSVQLAPDGWTAEVDVVVNGDVRLPANAFARLRQSSLLGEKFVELGDPLVGKPQGKLADNAEIPLDRTNRSAEVEEVFGALALVLNGGGLSQAQVITKELNNVLSGNEQQIRSLLTNVSTLTSELDSHKTEIVRALDNVNKLSATLAAQKDQIGAALDTLAPGIKILADQRSQLTSMLQAMDKLSATSIDVINRSRDDLLTDLKNLAPAVQKLAEAGDDLPQSFGLLLSYPFPDNVVEDIKGDYLNVFVDIDLNLGDLIKNLPPALIGLFPFPGVGSSNEKNLPLTELPLPSLKLPQLPKADRTTPNTGTPALPGLGGLLPGGRK